MNSTTTLTFNLPEEERDLRQSLNAWRAHKALYEIAEEIFRPARKHGYTDPKIHATLEKIDAYISDNFAEGVFPDASDLIGLLEEKFYEIIHEYKLEIKD